MWWWIGCARALRLTFDHMNVTVYTAYTYRGDKDDAWCAPSFREERDEIMDFVYRKRIQGVVFLSADAHYTLLTKWQTRTRNDDKAPLHSFHEFEVSPLGFFPFAPDKRQSEVSHSAKREPAVVCQNELCTETAQDTVFAYGKTRAFGVFECDTSVGTADTPRPVTQPLCHFVLYDDEGSVIHQVPLQELHDQFHQSSPAQMHSSGISGASVLSSIFQIASWLVVLAVTLFIVSRWQLCQQHFTNNKFR